MALRRQLAAAWDLAFNWVSGEPRQHHPAMPVSVLLALCSLALLWGWPREAAVFGRAWAGILRIGEIFAARRGDLVLPSDAAPGTRHPPSNTGAKDPREVGSASGLLHRLPRHSNPHLRCLQEA